MDIYLIQPKDLRHVWDDVKAGLAEMPESDWIPEDVYHAIKSGQVALHIGVTPEGFAGFMVLKPSQTEFSGKPTLHVWLVYNTAGADMMAAGEQLIRETARKMGAQKITFGSPRKGWAKRYNLVEATYEMPL